MIDAQVQLHHAADPAPPRAGVAVGQRRQAGPLGGAGLMLVALTATLWYGAAVPFSIDTLGVAAYRIFTLWAPLPPGFLALPTLRVLGQKAQDTPGRGTSTTKGEPALEH